jgi:exopolyphosphatase/guanosine-5'-triphosphate,3'-diphosphate pyrophosphatase
MKIAVIDLGTNTCNLLVAEINSTEYHILHQSKQLVRLGDNKIKSNEISPEATQRVLESFFKHQEIIEDFKVDKIRAIATSAVRSAANRIEFLEQIGEKTGYVVKVVSGEKEAELIFNGVLLAFQDFADPAVILDIGGGSNEIILVKDNEIIWKESRPTGMARVINQFEISDPILPSETETIRNYFSAQHKNAFEESLSENVKTLIGCSGAFDTIADIIDKVAPGKKQRITQKISTGDFYNVYDKIIHSTRDERLCMKGMDMVRVDLIVPAVILIEKLISGAQIENIIQTDFALREGVLFEMMNKD